MEAPTKLALLLQAMLHLLDSVDNADPGTAVSLITSAAAVADTVTEQALDVGLVQLAFRMECTQRTLQSFYAPALYGGRLDKHKLEAVKLALEGQRTFMVHCTNGRDYAAGVAVV